MIIITEVHSRGSMPTQIHEVDYDGRGGRTDRRSGKGGPIKSDEVPDPDKTDSG
jgi:hypothetical protein